MVCTRTSTLTMAAAGFSQRWYVKRHGLVFQKIATSIFMAMRTSHFIIHVVFISHDTGKRAPSELAR